MKKYEFTGETKNIMRNGSAIALHRIRAARGFGNIKKGDMGGWIETEDNLSHDGNAWVSGTRHVFTVGPIGSRDDFVTFFKDKGGGISVKCGCFFGNIGKFLEQVRKTHGDSKYAHEYRLAAENAKACIRLEAAGTEQGGNGDDETRGA